MDKPDNQSCPYNCQPIKISVHDRHANRFRCQTCGKTWVGHYRELNYGLKKSQAIINRAILMLNAGLSIRYIAKLNKLSPSTVLRWKKKYKIYNLIAPQK
jgi:transposase-like protein